MHDKERQISAQLFPKNPIPTRVLINQCSNCNFIVHPHWSSQTFFIRDLANNTSLMVLISSAIFAFLRYLLPTVGIIPVQMKRPLWGQRLGPRGQGSLSINCGCREFHIAGRAGSSGAVVIGTGVSPVDVTGRSVLCHPAMVGVVCCCFLKSATGYTVDGGEGLPEYG